MRGKVDNRPDVAIAELAAWVHQHAPEVVGDAEALSRLCVTRMLDGVPGSRVLPGIRTTLADLGIHHDVWFSEEGLHRWGRVRAVLDELTRRDYLEEREGALFFKSGDVGDDKDRVVRKRDGAYTYFASDIAYHADKVARGYDRLIVVLGADRLAQQMAPLAAVVDAGGAPGLGVIVRVGAAVAAGSALLSVLVVQNVFLGTFNLLPLLRSTARPY